jgi:hypothetical protein
MTDHDRAPEATPDDEPAPAAADEGAGAANPPLPSSADYTVAFSPRQVAVGLAIVAGLVAIAIGRHRGRKPPADG